MDRAEMMNLSIVLQLRNQDQLKGLLSRVYDPSGPEYRHFLTVPEFTVQFGPTEDDYQRVVDFARANGFEVTGNSANRLVVPISGTVDQVQKTFKVRMIVYQHPTENRTFFSPDRNPSLALNVPIAHIAGLNNYSVPQSMAIKGSAERSLVSTSVLGSGPEGSYLSSDMRAAYYGAGNLTGAGQTVGLMQFDGYNISDVIASFDGAASASASGNNYVLTYTPIAGGVTYTIPVENVLLDGASGSPGQFISPANDAEQVLDIVQAVGMAPGLSQVRVYIGNSDADILNEMASDTTLAEQISISWTWYPDDPLTDDAFFEEFAAQGQSVFVASGDYGAYSPSAPFYYPAEDAWVTAVGGTSLTTNGAGGALTSETAWDQSGGGVSPDNIPIPNWQAGVANSSNGGSSTLRNVPDVAMEADFDNYDCNMSLCSVGWAGTSFAAPRWAGFLALVNQQGAAVGDPAVGFVNPWIYATGEGPDYGSEFHDTAAGENNYEAGYGFYAVPGYDLVTGWGSPAGQNLIDGLAPTNATVGFQLSTSASSLIINPGRSGRTTIGVIDHSGFTGSVNLSVTSTLPSGVTAAFDTNPTNGTSVLTITTSITAGTGSYLVTITGTSGAQRATTFVTVNTPMSAVTITSPIVPRVPVTAQMFKPRTPIPIQGTVFGNFQDLHLDWAPGINSTSGWTSTGMSLSGLAIASGVNQSIGTWDTSSIVDAGYFTIRLSVDYQGITISVTTLVYLEPDLLSANWPRWLDITPNTYSGVVPVIDASGNTELGLMEPLYMGSSAQPRYRVFSLDGSSDRSTNLSTGSYLNPAFGNLAAGIGGESVVVDAPDLDVLAADGSSSMLTQGPEHVWYNMAQVELADLKGDSSLATVILGIQNWNDLAFVYAWGSDGELLNSNFPIQVPYTNIASMNTEDPGLVVGDIDGDGKQEIIVQESTSTNSFTLGLFANDGTPRSWSAPTFSGTLGQIIFADLDHNGKLETILVALPINSFDSMLHVLQPDGTERAGWPIDIGGGYTFLAAGDLARTGYDQIVAATHDNLFVLNSDGTTFSSTWPLPTSPFNPFGPVVLADIDGDGYPEILTSTADFSLAQDSRQGNTAVVRFPSPDGSNLRSSVQVQTSTPDDNSAAPYFAPTLHAFHRDGTVSRSWKLLGMHGEQPFYCPRITVGDFNHDGMTEIAVVNGLITGGGDEGSVDEGTLEVLTTGAPFNPAANDWPMISHDSQNSSATASANPVTPQVATPVFVPSAGTYTTAQTVTISDITPGAVIHYTTDGTTPSASSSAYSGPIVVFASETVEAIATAAGDSPSAISTAAYVLPAVVPAPTFYPAQGTYASMQSVSLTDSQPGATIYYTTNGTTPTTSSNFYGTPIPVSASETIEAMAVETGYTTSPVATAAYTINPALPAPTFFPAAGTYTIAQTVSISDATAGATIYYSTNGTTPTTSSTKYTSTITVSASESLEAIAVETGFTNSSVATAAYTIELPSAATPTSSPASGTYTSAQTVSISDATAGATIYYTTNGTTPTTTSTLYVRPITVASSETIEAIAIASGYSSSPVSSDVYTINLPAAAPVFTPAQGAYISTQTVSISDPTPGSVIYYTTNGTAPTTASSVYSGSITVSATATLEAVATASGYAASPVSSAVYTITPPTAVPSFIPAQGTYTSIQTVSMSDPTPGSVIRYTTNGTTPTTSSSIYTGPITVSATETIEAIALATGYSQSAVSTAIYTITPPAILAPTMSSISPAFTDAGSPAFNLTITGSGFTLSSAVYWGTSALTTQFLSATQLTAQVPATLVANSGVSPISVQNPDAGGTTSSALQFEVDSAAASASSPTFTTTTATVSAGSTATYPVTLPSSATNVSATCLNLPSGATCSYSTATGAVTINTKSSTPDGIYPITVVFAETIPGASTAWLLFPILLMPLASVKKRGAYRKMWFAACLLLGMALASSASGCGGSAGGGVSPSPTPTQQVTSSGVVSITVK
jgi:hypothetical protein